MGKNEDSFFLNYLPISITLVSLEKAELPPFLGSTLRGVIGQALFQDKNAYNYLYHNGKMSSNMQDIINPYVLIPPDTKKKIYFEKEELNFKILLLGEGVQYARQLVNAIQQIRKLGLGASRYKFELNKITHSLDQRIIWEKAHFYEIAIRSAALPYHCLPDVSQLHIQMLTPLRIRRNGNLLEELDFTTIIRNIARRIEMITERYGGWCDQLEIGRILELSGDVSVIRQKTEILNMERYSNRLGKKMDFSGLVGDIWFEGDLTPFVPWLYAAQIVHFGRNTTFGMGRTKMEFI